MQHHERAGPMEVDHFDPRRKNDLIQRYENLFLASRHCNEKKFNHWPNKVEKASGCRFLNPCEEVDYGEQIFEEPGPHRLVGVTPAARWHIRMCGLNAQHLVYERAKRAEYWKLLKQDPIAVRRGTFEDVRSLADGFKAEVELMIPPIAWTGSS